jgi:hypothetical protein
MTAWPAPCASWPGSCSTARPAPPTWSPAHDHHPPRAQLHRPGRGRAPRAAAEPPDHRLERHRGHRGRGRRAGRRVRQPGRLGLDSGIEVSAAVILAWRLAQERRQGCTQAADRRATQAIALSFFALAAYVGVESIRDLLGHVQPEASIPGIVLAALSLVVMPLLARAKRKVAPVLGSRAAVSEANQTSLCALLSAVLLVGLAANAALGWWADPAAGLGIAALAAIEGVRT